MAIIKIIFRKMINNRWLTGSLFLGLLLTVSLVSSIPTYMSAVFHKLLASELENYYQEEQQYPGEFSYSVNFTKDEDIDVSKELTNIEEWHEGMIKETGIPLSAHAEILSSTPMSATFLDKETTTDQKSGKLLALTNIKEHITITDGSFPKDRLVDGVYEAIVPEKALLERDMVLGDTFVLHKGDTKIKVRPVGTFVSKDLNDPYWASLPPDSYSSDFIVDESLYRSSFIEEHITLLETSKFVSAFDYTQLFKEDIPTLLELENKVSEEIADRMDTILLVDFPTKDLIGSYESKGDQLTMMLWSLNVPVLVMLGVYLFMVSRLIINRQVNEIAVLASRGAKRAQILLIYFIEISMLGALAFVLGPPIGLFLCKILGGTNGFLEFVQRTSLPVHLQAQSFLYGFLAILVAIVMVMIPVFQASKQSIINQKHQLANQVKGYKWYSVLLDLVLLSLAIYGLFTFKTNRGLYAEQSAEMPIDPTLFFLPAIFIIGLGLFILRIYPLLLKLINKLGEKFWSISLYATFVQVSRSAKQYQFFMVFLIMTIGMGVFSASAARTINGNLEEQILYENGADITMETKWDSNAIQASTYGGQEEATNEEQGKEESASDVIVYTEPPFEPFEEIKGIEQVTKVFEKDAVKAETNGKTIFAAQLMAIEPKKFGETAWFKPTLLDHHWYQYLNLLAQEPSSVLISRTTAESLGAKVGDYMTMQWDGSDSAEFVIYGIVDYWPAFNPNEKKEDGNTPSLVVANLPYVQNLMGLEPYEVWLKADENASRADIYASMKNIELPIVRMDDNQPKVIELKNSAFLLGLNGMLTLGFIISILLSFIGFLLYWTVTLKSRTLQYGIYRAMGIPIHKLIGILIWEQLMTSGVACMLGILVGGITSRLFVPLFQLSFDPTQVVPPFEVIFAASDELKIYLFVVIMLGIGLTILVTLLRKINIHQAVKLGEDS
ncbi:FtsX-like permease family protein [Radiobacillus kanasensis]|uniref:ABC transporter permease n=1 Tax=Radiobacillus kanasensis TaxID=2844358 RepID=UPI001E3FF2ED|nr:FtsX-like permease family protein [Radiobacillus kanasensis]UFT99662.1 FtsX-like permease family protein [Radiobacillus kanasensis]